MKMTAMTEAFTLTELIFRGVHEVVYKSKVSGPTEHRIFSRRQ